MSRLHPTQGPGPGVRMQSDGAPITVSSDGLTEGRIYSIDASGTDPYATNEATITADKQANGLLGVAVRDGAQGDVRTVTISGVAKAIAGAAIAIDTPVTCILATGRLTATVAGVRVIGRTLEASAADGDLILVDFDGDQGFGQGL